MIEVGQIWTNKSFNEDVRIIEIDYQINCAKFYILSGGITYVSALPGFTMRYYYNAEKTNNEIIKSIIE